MGNGLHLLLANPFGAPCQFAVWRQGVAPKTICQTAAVCWLKSCMPTFCGASGAVVALRLPEAQLGMKGFCMLLVLAPLLLGSCDSVGSAELLAWLLLSKVAGRPLHNGHDKRGSSL